MSKITTLNEKAIAVQIPEELRRPMIHYNQLWLCKKGTTWRRSFCDLPEGPYEILGRPEEITEEQWKGIVERAMPFGRVGRYMDYEYPDSAFYEAKTSGLSLLKSKSLEGASIIILIKQ